MNTNQYEMRIGNYDLSYQIRNGGDRCVLFIHGLGCSSDSFKHAFDENYFSEDFTLLAPDLLGHGNSSKPEDSSYALEKQCDLVLELVQKLNIKSLNIVAHSMGNVVALLLIEKLNNVHSIFCLEGNLAPEDCQISQKVSSLEETNFVNKIYPMTPLTFACKGLPLEKVTSPIAFYRSAKSLVHWSTHGGLLEKYINLSIQKTYVYGEENKEINILKKLQNTDLLKINGSGHFMMMDNPTETYKGIADRLDTLLR